MKFRELLSSCAVFAALLACPAAFAQCPPGGPCCAAHSAPGCSDGVCCTAVCGSDPYCCAVHWDDICAAEAASTCFVCGIACGSGNPGDCCAAHTGVGCSDHACCSTVCAADQHCCNISWDALCVQEAMNSCSLCPLPCDSDLNGDGQTNGADLGILLGNWECSGDACPGDLNGDGVVNGADLGILLGHWGPCP